MTSTTERWVDAEIPEKLEFFNKWGKWRYKVAKGGRGSGKSRTIATILAARGVEVPLRWFCARETQKSQRFSSMQLIEDAINRLGLRGEYDILTSDKQIRGKRVWPDGRRTVFPFEGIRELSVDSIKSLEDFDGIWLAEAHEITKESWNKITPTFRKDAWACKNCRKAFPGRMPPARCSCGGALEKDHAEIWVDFNPEFEEDFITTWCAQRADDPNCMIAHVTYMDNFWFPDSLRADLERDRRDDPDTYRWVWLGEPRNSVVGAVYGKEIATAYGEGRFVQSPGIGVDRTKPVDTFWDLGHGDPMAIWFAQALTGWVNVVDFYQNAGEAIEHYVSVIQSKGYQIGTCWLPWDGVDARTHHNLTGSNSRSPEQVLRGLGLKVRIAPKTDVDIGIASVRTIFPQLRFDEPKCFEGIRHLRAYQWGPALKDGKVITKPRHDDHSHAADALRTLASSAREPRTKRATPLASPWERPVSAWG